MSAPALARQNDPRPDDPPRVSPGRVECHAADLTYTASAEVTLDQLDSQLVRHGQWCPADAPGTAQLGMMVEHDATGPLRLGFGGLRDLLLGVQFEDGLGRLITVGGRVMKNVAGYDLTKFMIGQRGVFGRVITLTGRTYRRPEAALAARMPPSTDPLRLHPLPSWLIEVRGGLWAGWLGTQHIIAHASSGLERIGSVQVIRHGLSDDQALRERLWALPGDEDGGEEMRISLPPGDGRIGAFVVAQKLLYWTCDPWHGLLKARVPPSQQAAVRDAAWSLGGRAELLHGPVRVTRGEADVLRRLKHQFDPDQRLAPLELEVVP